MEKLHFVNRFRAFSFRAFFAFGVGALSFSPSIGWAQNPPHWAHAPTPPTGWNSYDAYGASVTEAEVLANAIYLKEHLFAFGYQHVVVDYRWSDATAANYKPNGIGGPLTADSFGRLLPAPNRFPSAVRGGGFKALADQIHAMGLKFGIHVMRGIPRQSVTQNTPIEKSSFRAADAADTKSTCGWCKDMWGVNADTQAGQDYYDSIFRLYASWGVDFVKVDDLSAPYHEKEIAAIRKAIDRCGRPMVFSTSPGATPVNRAEHVSQNANMWRISSDFWDNWGSLDRQMDHAAAWAGLGGAGRWPDGDMIPLGRIGIRCEGKDRQTRFTKDEQVSLLSLFAVMPSPLMLGMSLPDLDPWTLGLITNRQMLAINQDPLALPAKRVLQIGKTDIWLRDLSQGSKAIALFNRADAPVTARLELAALGLAGHWRALNAWSGQDLGPLGKSADFPVPAHGSMLLKITPFPEN